MAPLENSSKVMSNQEIALSKRVLAVQPSATLAITAKSKELKAQGIDIVSLSAGEPDFDTADFIKQSAIEAIQKGDTRYTPAPGTMDLRKEIAAKLERDQNLKFPPEQIIVSCGAKHSVFNVLFALLNPEDEVLIPAPYWLSYPEMVNLIGAKNVFVETTEATAFKLTPEILRKSLTPKTKVLILNSPSNPTGSVYSKEELLALIPVLKEFPNVVVVSDEIYEKLIFDGKSHVSIAMLDEEIAARTVIVNGHSKAYAMTGWRLGYAACPNLKLAKAVGSLQSHSTSNPTSFAQPGGITALQKGDEQAKMMCETFQKRRDLFIQELSTIKELEVIKPEGAFYLFVNISKSGLSSLEITAKLLEEAHVAVVPGQPFGSDKHVRMGFATSDEQLKKAADRLRAWFQKNS